ncbi:MAG: hypothetical protein ACK4UQ_01235 [Brevundimonas sp.]
MATACLDNSLASLSENDVLARKSAQKIILDCAPDQASPGIADRHGRHRVPEGEMLNVEHHIYAIESRDRHDPLNVRLG